MAFELSKQLLGKLIEQQREQEFQTQTPQWQMAVDQMFANRIQFAQNQLLRERIESAKTPDELLEAIKTVAPEVYMKRRQEQGVQSDILGMMANVPEAQRDYGMINFLASTVGWGDVGPIEQRPMSEGRLEQEIKLRSTAPYDRYGVYLGRPTTTLRQQREREFKKMWERGILYQGQAAPPEQRERLQNYYLQQGFIPKEFEVKPEPVKETVPARPTKAMMDEAEAQTKLLITKDEQKLQTAGLRGKAHMGLWGLDVDETLDNLKALPPAELQKLNIDPELKNMIKLFQKYGRAKEYTEYGAEYFNQYIMPEEVPFDPANPAFLPLPPLEVK